MIEIIIVFSLCKNARENTLQRGGSGGIAILYTIVLWFGMEIYGAVIGSVIGILLGWESGVTALAYVLGLGCAGLGGYIAILISKIKAPIDLFSNNLSNQQIPANDENGSYEY